MPATSINTSLDIGVSRKTNGQQYWNSFYNYPQHGLSLSYTRFGNEILGSSLAISNTLRFEKLIRTKLQRFIQYEIGLAWFDKPFDASENPENYVFGSRYAARVAVALGVEFEMTRLVSSNLSIEFVHLSNAHLNVPNIGGNTINGVIGLKLRSTNLRSEILEHEIQGIDKKWHPGFSFGLGLHEIEGTIFPSDGPKYIVYFGELYAQKRMNYMSNLTIGLNISYYDAFHDFIINQQLFDEDEKENSYKAFVYGAHDFIFGHLALTTQLGVNLYFPFRKAQIDQGYKKESFFHLHNSNVLGFKYYFKDTRSSLKQNPFVGLGLRSIGGKADFAQMWLGMTF